MNYAIFLDDLRMPDHVTWLELPSVKWFIVRNYKDFIYKIEKDGLPQIISFDHDLSLRDADTFVNSGRIEVDYNKYQEKTGKDCAEWLVQYCIYHKVALPECYIHSKNPIGCRNIQLSLEDYQKYKALFFN